MNEKARRAVINSSLAYRVATWLEKRGCTTTIALCDEFRYEVHYTLARDVIPQPPVKIDGSIVFPKGSQEDVILQFFMGQ